MDKWLNYSHRWHFRDIWMTFLLGIIILFTQCKSVSNVIPVHEETIVHHIDSVIIRDSIVEIPKEVYVNLVWNYDTLHLETSLAEADCWLDSLFLRGEIHNKKNFTQHTTTQEHIIYKDSIVEKPVPYPVEVVKEVKPWTFYMYRWTFWILLSFVTIYFGWKYKGTIVKFFIGL